MNFFLDIAVVFAIVSVLVVIACILIAIYEAH